MSECVRSRIERRSHSCSGTPPQGAPVPQPVFVSQPNSAGQNVHLRSPVPFVAGQAVPAPVFPQPVPGDVFGVGLGGPARYTASVQNAQAGPSHQRPLRCFLSLSHILREWISGIPCRPQCLLPSNVSS